MARSSPIFVPIVGEDKLSKKLASVQSRVSKFASGVSKVGKSLTSHVTLPLGVAGVASVKLAKDFNESMANVATLIPGQKRRIMELHDSVLDLAAGMGKSYMRLGNRVAALESYRRALRLNPGMDDVRAQVIHLQRILQEEED